MTPTHRRLAKLEQASQPTTKGTWGIVTRYEHEPESDAIKREYGDGPVPENLIWIIGVAADL